MSLFPLGVQLCELSLMCEICQMFCTILNEAFVKVEEARASSSSPETVAGRVDELSHPHSFVCPSHLAAPLWRLDRLIPPRESSRPPCLVCVSASSLLPVSVFIVLPPTPTSPFLLFFFFLNQAPWMLHWSRKNNQLPFCFRSHLNRRK